MSCSGDVFGAGGNSCFGGRTTVGMIRLWRAVSSSVASSRVYSNGFIGKRDQANVHATKSISECTKNTGHYNPLLKKSLFIGVTAWCIPHKMRCGCHDSSHLNPDLVLSFWIDMEQLTQPVASNILRSSGSPDSWPSILVREWQVAIHATNRDLTRFSL